MSKRHHVSQIHVKTPIIGHPVSQIHVKARISEPGKDFRTRRLLRDCKSDLCQNVSFGIPRKSDSCHNASCGTPRKLDPHKARSTLHEAYVQLGSPHGADHLAQSLHAAWIHTRRGALYTKLTRNDDPHTARSCLHIAYEKLPTHDRQKKRAKTRIYRAARRFKFNLKTTFSAKNTKLTDKLKQHNVDLVSTPFNFSFSDPKNASEHILKWFPKLIFQL